MTHPSIARAAEMFLYLNIYFYTPNCVGTLCNTSSVAEITQKLYYMTRGQPHCSRAISLAELSLRVLQRDQPWVLLADTDTISSRNPWHTRTGPSLSMHMLNVPLTREDKFPISMCRVRDNDLVEEPTIPFTETIMSDYDLCQIDHVDGTNCKGIHLKGQHALLL